MYRYIIIAIYPLLGAACGLAAYQTRKLSRDFPSDAWTFKRKLTLGFALFQVYGLVRTFTVRRTFTWADPIYVLGLLVFFIGLNTFDYLLRRDVRGLRLKAIKVFIPQPPISGDLSPEFWEQKITEVVRTNIKPEYLVEIKRVTTVEEEARS